MRKIMMIAFVFFLHIAARGQTSLLDSLGISVGEVDTTRTTFKALRYWFDTDVASKQTTTQQSGTFTLDASSLRDGVHSVNYEVIDSEGKSTALCAGTFLKMTSSLPKGTTAKELRYWFDTDVASAQTTTQTGGVFSFDASSLRDGLHSINYEVIDSEGKSTALCAGTFLKMTSSLPKGTTAKELRYWFDTDVASAQTTTQTNGMFNLNASALRDGIHTVNYQIVDSEGKLVSLRSGMFLKMTLRAATVKATGMRFWFDNDPTTMQTTDLVGGIFTLDASALPGGEHIIKCQIFDADGTALQTMSGTFLKAHFVVEPDGEGIAIVDNPDGSLAERISRVEELKILHVTGTIAETDVANIRELPSLLVLYWDSSQEMPAIVSSGKNENLLVYVDSTATVVGEDGKNIIQHGSTGSVTLADGKPLIVTEEFVAEEVAYTRSFSKETGFGTSSGWETMTLPFDVQEVVTADGRQLRPMRNTTTDSFPYWLGEYGASGFAHSSSIVANVPYVVSMPHNDDYIEEYNIEGDVTFSAKDATLKPTRHLEGTAGASFRFMTAYETVAKSDTVFAINDEEVTLEGTVYPAGSVFVRNLRDVRPFECYFVPLTNEAKMREFISMGGNNDANAILAITKDARLTNQDVYSLDGRLVRRATDSSISTNRLSPGVYLIGGKKVLVK